MWGCSIEPTEDPENPFCFEISHPDRKSFFLKASSEQEMDDWIQAILNIVETGKMEQKIKRELFWMTHFGPEKREITWDAFFTALKKDISCEIEPEVEHRLRFVIGTFAASKSNSQFPIFPS